MSGLIQTSKAREDTAVQKKKRNHFNHYARWFGNRNTNSGLIVDKIEGIERKSEICKEASTPTDAYLPFNFLILKRQRTQHASV